VLAQTEKRENEHDHHDQSDQINYRVHCQSPFSVRKAHQLRLHGAGQNFRAPALLVKRLLRNLVPQELWPWISAALAAGTGTKSVWRRFPPLKR
jgi:hypothetical protein